MVADRKKYLETLSCVEHRLLTQYPPPSSYQSIQPPIIRVFHDESTLYASADQSRHWADGSKTVLKQKSLGQAIMVSDFIDEVDGMAVLMVT